jgi:carnitine O-acetyltransferase
MCLENEEQHALFSHSLLAKSSRWQLSTSSLQPSETILGTGFGAGYADGYGINYTIAPSIIKIGIESKNSCKFTSSKKFAETLVDVYGDMKRMCESKTDSKL